MSLLRGQAEVINNNSKFPRVIDTMALATDDNFYDHRLFGEQERRQEEGKMMSWFFRRAGSPFVTRNID